MKSNGWVMGATMEPYKKMGMFNIFNTLVKWFLVILLGVMASLSFYQVVMRYVFNNASSWSEELVRFLFIWCSFIAAAIGIKEHIHIGVDIFVKLLPEKIANLTEVLVNLGIMFFSSYMVYYGWSVVMVTRRQLSPALRIPMSWVYLSIPAMGVLLLLYCSIEIVNAVGSFKEEERA